MINSNKKPDAVITEVPVVECAASTGATVQLNGTGSSDFNGDTLTYLWTVPDNSTTFDDPSSSTPSALFPVGATGVQLVVNDGLEDSDPAATATVEVRADTTPPSLSLSGLDTLALECSVDTYIEEGASVSDDCDPAVAVSTGGDAVNASLVGNYTVTYDARDASGNAADQITRSVDVEDTSKPVLTLIGSETMTLECSVDTYNEEGASASDECDPTVAVSTGGDSVDGATVGNYSTLR